MMNAFRFDTRITIGAVPSGEDFDQLRSLGYKTLVDVRDPKEKFGQAVERAAATHSITYVSIPVDRSQITIENVVDFYRAVFRKGSAPIYAFSRFGRRPLAFLLLFDAVRGDKALRDVFSSASGFGLNLEEDECLHSFLVAFFRNPDYRRIVDSIRDLRPDLFDQGT